jgi:hypothetical protein
MNFRKPGQNTLLGLAAAAMLFAATPGAVRAESNVGPQDVGAFGIIVDPNASGTKISNSVAFAYEYETGTTRAQACDSSRWVKNLHIVATVQKGNALDIVSSNYSLAGLDNLQDCWDNQPNQLAFFRYFIEQVVIAKLYNCVSGGCPPYAVKSIKNFLTTGVGGASLEVELAVK